MFVYSILRLNGNCFGLKKVPLGLLYSYIEEGIILFYQVLFPMYHAKA